MNMPSLFRSSRFCTVVLLLGATGSASEPTSALSPPGISRAAATAAPPSFVIVDAGSMDLFPGRYPVAVSDGMDVLLGVERPIVWRPDGPYVLSVADPDRTVQSMGIR